MKFGIIAPEFPPEAGGMQEHAARLVECLARDHEVRLFTGHARARALVPEGVIVESAMRWRESADMPRLSRAGVEAWLVLNAGISPYICQLREPAFAYVHGNDLVHPWYPRASNIVRLARRLLPPERRDGFTTRWRRRHIARGLQAARMVITNSRFTRELCLAATTLAPDSVAVVAPGIGTEFFQTVQRRPDNCLRIMTTARLEGGARRKNIDGVLEAVARLRGELDIFYTVVGDGNDRARLERRALELGIGEQVSFTGHVGRQRLRCLLASSHLFVMAVSPSAKDVEGFGMVYAEAAAAGLPSLATATGGTPDAVKHGVTGILLPDGSPAAIADGIRQFQRERDRFDPKVIQSFARNLSAARCTARLVSLIRHSLTPSLGVAAAE